MIATRKLDQIFLSTFASTILAAAAWGSICVPDGTSATITFTQPPLPAGSGGWTPGSSPNMKENDPLSDDEMGPASSTSPGSATGNVTNSGGDLFGPRGGDQNGGTEGPCIEVKMCWEYEHWVPPVSILIEDPVWGWIWATLPGYWDTREICSEPPVEVCPSGSGGCP